MFLFVAIFIFSFLSFSELQSQEVSSSENIKEKTDSLNRLARSHSVFEENSRNTTYRYANEALSHAEKIQYVQGMLEALDIIAYWTIIAGNIEQAIVLGYRQLRLAEDFGKPRFIARALSNIGFAAGQQTKSDSSTRNQARVHLLKALEIARSLQDTLLESTCLNSLGRLSRIEQDWQKALALHQRAFQQAKAIKNPEQEAWSLHSMGAIYEALKLYDSAMIFAKEAYNIRTKAKQDFGEAVSLRLIALLHFRLKNYELALKYLKQSIQACQNHEGLFLVKLEAYRLLVIIYKELGNNSGELEAFRNYVIIKDSAEVIESQKSIAILQSRLESERQESEKEILVRDKKIQEIQIQRQRVVGVSIIGGVIILLFVILNLVRTSRISKQQHLKLQDAYHEIQRQKEVLEVQAGEIEIANTQLQEMNTTLEYSNKELDEANGFKLKMLSIASHDLKNPLHLISMLSELLQEEHISPEEVRGFAQKIHHTSFRMTELVRDLLDIAAQEMGKMSINREMINMTEIVKSVLEQYQLDFESKKQHIECIGSEQEFWLEGDENKLHQVVGNLVSNAIKYSPFGKTITVRLFEKKFSELQDTGKKIVLQVEDEGPGISSEDMEKAFTLFQRLSAKTTGGESSHGVGLALVKTIVTLHNGSVWCESELGKGATFIVELPAE